MGEQGKLADTPWSFVASGLLVCVFTICVAYFLARIWPRQHYPRFFGTLGGIATVAGLYVMDVPGAGFGLIALAVLAYIALVAADDFPSLFETEKQAPKQSTSTGQLNTSWSGLGFFITGCAVGLLLAGALISALVLPPAQWKNWFMHTDSVGDRIARALDPGEQWVSLQNKERTASEALRKTQAELANISKRAVEAEAALGKARDELGAAAPNTVRGIRIKSKSGSRHANGAVYIGVQFAPRGDRECWTTISSDKVDTQNQRIVIGTAATIMTSKGKYRVVLVALDEDSCTFDLVKD
jgi:hypothetical protein